MKAKLLLLITLLCLSGCSLLWGPTATVKKFIASAEKGDVDKMMDLFSSKAMAQMGREKIKSNNQNFSDMARKVIAGGGKPTMNEVQEVVNGNSAKVSFVYQNQDKNNSIGMVFDLSKESGAWKIDNIGDRESEVMGLAGGPAPAVSPSLDVEPPPPPVSSAASPASPPAVRAPISGGVLNAKATSLPQPPYPPVARAAKASGTVVVQILVDENGNVVSAHAISGHPLLQAACVAAARSAKFTPTKLSGQPVKVSGIVTYNFAPPQ